MSHSKLAPIPRDPRGEADPTVLAARRSLVETAAGRSLPYLGGRAVEPARVRGNIENLIGFAQVPIGIAGPLLLQGSSGTAEYYVPMATTEGAMVASYSRGMGVLRAAGGVRARVLLDELSQHPILVYGSSAAAEKAAELALSSLASWRALVARSTRHGKLLRIEPQCIGRRLILRLVFHTADAIGINMAAQAAENCARDLHERSAAIERYVHGQDVEKRSNARALVEGRGKRVRAEATLTRELVSERLRTTPEAMESCLKTYAVGFAQLGTQNWTVQAANGLAAVYLACGQDVAYVTEAATGHLEFAATDEGDLYASVVLPSLLIGTVGGGSGQGTAAECLDLLGCRGTGGAHRFAEILAATVLAGDISLVASFCNHEFVAAHERLGRNRPQAGAVDAADAPGAEPKERS